MTPMPTPTNWASMFMGPGRFGLPAIAGGANPPMPVGGAAPGMMPTGASQFTGQAGPYTLAPYSPVPPMPAGGAPGGFKPSAPPPAPQPMAPFQPGPVFGQVSQQLADEAARANQRMAMVQRLFPARAGATTPQVFGRGMATRDARLSGDGKR